MKELLVLHKKMYNVRWDAAEGDSAQLEKEFMALAEREGVDLDKVNEMLEQLYIPPYEKERLPKHLRSNRGGLREGAGRPAMGITKKVSITLSEEQWEKIDKEKGKGSYSAYFRELVEDMEDIFSGVDIDEEGNLIIDEDKF